MAPPALLLVSVSVGPVVGAGVFALSDQVSVGLLALAGVGITALAGVITALIARDANRQNKQVGQAVDEVEQAWEDRGRLLQGAREDLAAALDQIDNLKGREQRSLGALEDAHATIAILKARLRFDTRLDEPLLDLLADTLSLEQTMTLARVLNRRLRKRR